MQYASASPEAGIETITVTAKPQQAAIGTAVSQVLSWLGRNLLARPAAWVARWAIVAVGAGPFFVRHFPGFAHSAGIARPANFQFIGQKPAVPSGLADFGRNVVNWGSGVREALARSSNITAQEAAGISPGQAAAARNFMMQC